jgi:hypothetical protein
MRDGLAHKFLWASDDGKFFAAIDESGGWPVGYRYVGFSHSEGREAGFCNSPNNDGWWTVIASADDYYLWKLSPEALKRVTDAAVRHFIKGLTANTTPSEIWIADSQGYRAATARATGTQP